MIVMAMAMDFCTVKGLLVSQLPSGGTGSASGEAKDDQNGFGGTLEQFIKDVLSEAIPFVDSIQPKSGGESTWKSRGSPKKHHGSDALVQQLEKTVPAKDSRTKLSTNGSDEAKKGPQNETWFCRKSYHKNSAEKGTASWEEFRRGFKEHHAETEQKFISTVMAVRKAVGWKTDGLEVELNGERWTNVSMELWEMKHKIDPKPLHNRTFPQLHITAALAGTEEFIIVQIPVPDFEKSPFSEFARDKNLVIGVYTSVERIRILSEKGGIEWIMATASNAGGVLPQWIQNMAVPGEISKDVQKFLVWIPTQRSPSANIKP